MIITKVSKVYHNKNNNIKALDNIDLSFENNGLVIILGSSGSGKTTLLNILTNNIKDYEGTITNVPSISYLNQDVILFESMSIYDNLLAICDDKNVVLDYLHYFKLEDLKNKKVNKLSKGQKRRVQLLCAFLNNKEVLLCDEPTAALDHDNSKLVMDMLKELSKNKLVIMVTHDIALSETYADRIIELKGGRIVKDCVINKTDTMSYGSILNKKKFKNHLIFAIKHLFTNPLKLIVNSFIIFLMIFSLSLMFTSYKDINRKLDYLDAFEKGDNIIVSYNSEKVSTKDKNAEELGFNDCSIARNGYSDFYVNYDRIPYHRINAVLNSVDNIIGVNVLVDGFEYSRTDEEMELYELNDKTFKHLIIAQGISRSIFQLFTPYNNPFIMDKNFPLVSEIYDGKYDLRHLDSLAYEIYDYYARNIFKNSIDLFYMQNADIPLSYGNLPKNEKEVIIDINTANKLLKLYSLSDYSELLNKTVILGQFSMAMDYLSYSIDNNNFKLLEDNKFILDYRMIPSFDYIISGITAIQNKGMNMIFTNADILENDMLSEFVVDDKELCFKSVKFILDPDSDIDKVTKEINDILGLTRTKFVSKSQITANNMVLKRNNENLITYMSVSFVLFITCYIINEILNRSKTIKENRLLKEYNYNYYLINFIQSFITFTLSFIILLLISDILVNYLNNNIQNIGYSFVFSNSFKYSMLATSLIFIVNSIIITFTRRVK